MCRRGTATTTGDPSVAEPGAALVLTAATVKTHVGRILAELGV
jgi:hypothetical protein